MTAACEERPYRMHFHGVLAEFMRDQTEQIDLEGAFRSGKTTAALCKVLQSCLVHPGIHWLCCRYSESDTMSKLRPPWRAICAGAGIDPKWDANEMCDRMPNGSKVYFFGLKAQTETARYAKLRGITLAGIYNDQTEELPYGLYLEFTGRLSQTGMPHQLILTPNPPDENHWMATAFPESNLERGRRYYAVSVYENAHNLSTDTIRRLEEAYPAGHSKHRSAVLGLRGLAVEGKPVYAGAFRRSLHERPLAMNRMLPLCEAIDFGKHNPCVVWCQFTPFGGIDVLGGIMGKDLYFEDFLPIVLRYRADWFGDKYDVQTCCDPAGSHDNSQGIRMNGVTLLREHGFAPQWKENANAPDVRFAMTERLASYMRRRTASGHEAFGVDNSRWLRIDQTTVTPWKFILDGCESGYVWDEHYVSVGSKQVRKPKKDGWFEHGQNCLEYLELNFGGAQPSVRQIEQHHAKVAHIALRRSQRDNDPFRWASRRVGRGGYG